MTVYVDTMKAKYRGMIMCHMIADTWEELHDMADKIGVQRKWFQKDHYDICQTKKALAIKYGAVEVCMTELASMCERMKLTKEGCGKPEAAKRWYMDIGRPMKLERMRKAKVAKNAST